MKTIAFTTLFLFSLPLFAQSLGQSVGLYIYPAEGQSSEQISQDDYECFNWAKESTGFDPVSAQAPEQVQSDGAARGSGLRGAVRGAATGALVAEVTDNSGSDGAKAGAVLGAIGGRSAGNAQAQAQANAANNANQAAFAEQKDGFNRAMSACLQGRGYTVQ